MKVLTLIVDSLMTLEHFRLSRTHTQVFEGVGGTHLKSATQAGNHLGCMRPCNPIML